MRDIRDYITEGIYNADINTIKKSATAILKIINTYGNTKQDIINEAIYSFLDELTDNGSNINIINEISNYIDKYKK